MRWLQGYSWIDLPRNLLVFVIYLAIAKLGLVFTISESSASIFWPAGGFALAVLLLAGPKYIAGIFAGALGVGLITGGGAAYAVVSALGNTLETALAYWLLTSFKPINTSLEHLKDFLKILLYGAILSPLVSAIIGPVALVVLQAVDVNLLPGIALRWWMGDAIGIAAVTPLLLIWYQSRKPFRNKFTIELTTLFFCTIFIGSIVFFHWFHPSHIADLDPSWLFPFIIWSALRAGRRYTSLLIFIILVQALWGASNGLGHFSNDLYTSGLINFWVFGMMMIISGLALAIVFDENKKKQSEANSYAIELREKEERLSLATVSNGVGIWDLYPQTEELIWDDSMFSLFHINKEDFSGAYDAWVSSLHPDDREQADRELNTALAGGKSFNTDFRVIWPNGEIRNIKGIAKVFCDDAGTPIRMLGINADITAQKQSEEKLTLAANVFTHARESITITDAEGTIIDVNETFTVSTGYSREEAIGQNPRFLRSGRQSAEFYEDMWQTLLEDGYWYGELWNRRKNGEIHVEMKTISAVRNEHGITTHYVALSNDITHIKEHQKQLERMGNYDMLTNLPNRSLLADRLSHAMSHCQRQEQSLAVIFLDLDNFKNVNDTHGHDVGDDLLIALSTRMMDALRKDDTLARIGGDEFVAILEDVSKIADCEPVLERLLQAASKPVVVSNKRLQVSASIGVTFYPQDNVENDQLMRHADQAMYIAKQSGKNRYHIFDTAQDDAFKAQRESLEAIRNALDNHQFVLHYQPKVNMKTGSIIGVEALIRWQHPELGLLNPIKFLPIIENNSMIIEMGEWVIDTALAQMHQWKTSGLNFPVGISVNIAALQLQQPNFKDRLSTLIAAHPDVDPCCLELEVLETTALDNLQNVANIMHDCMALGVNFSLDDFGTGYSSLTYLRRLPASLIKIDQSFVREMLTDTNDLAIVEGVIGLAKSFKRDVIAEGVETIEHGTALLNLGCELAQGYGIAKPMPASELPKWANEWKPDTAWRTDTTTPSPSTNL